MSSRLQRLMMTTDAVGGVWTYSLELAAGLAERGIRTMLAVLGPGPTADQRRTALRIPGLTLADTGLDLEWRDRSGPVPDAQLRLRAMARTFRPDVVHVNGFREAGYGFDVPVALVAHSCVGTWWRACRGTDLPAEWSAYAAGVRAGIAAADAIVAPTAAFLHAFEAYWGRIPDARVIHNGVQSPALPSRPRRPFILAAGRFWDEAKNLALLAEAAPRLPWPVHVAGDGAGHAGNVHWLGPCSRETLLAQMREAEIFCAPARYEPFGLTALEAALSGAALVLADLETSRELWSDAARFFSADRPEDLVGTIRNLIDDEALRRRLQRASRRRALRYSRQRMADAYCALYESLSGDVQRRECAA